MHLSFYSIFFNYRFALFLQAINFSKNLTFGERDSQKFTNLRLIAIKYSARGTMMQYTLQTHRIPQQPK
jgi:hypothetical protein